MTPFSGCSLDFTDILSIVARSIRSEMCSSAVYSSTEFNGSQDLEKNVPSYLQLSSGLNISFPNDLETSVETEGINKSFVSWPTSPAS